MDTIEAGVVGPVLAALLVVPHGPPQIDRAADPVLREEHGAPVAAQRAQGVDDGGGMGHALVGVLIGENVFPYVRAGIGEAADARFRNALAEESEGLGLGGGAGPQLAVAPRSVGVPLAGEFGRGIAHLAGGRFRP